MKSLLMVIFSISTLSSPVLAQNGYRQGTGSNYNNNYVQPHTRSNGSYVGGHYRTNPNTTQSDNYDTSGNYNPYNGHTGTSKY